MCRYILLCIQDVDVSTYPANSCALFITVHSHTGHSKRPALSAKFQFENHIRCVAARQCLQRNRENLRLAKMTRIAKLLDLPVPDPSDGALCLEQARVSSAGSFLQQTNSELRHSGHPELSCSEHPKLPRSEHPDLPRSGLHQALQEPNSPPTFSSQNIEMDQFHTTYQSSEVSGKN